MAKPVITLHSPADILAAIPALVRFVPDNSVVALMFSHASGGQVLDVRCAIRFDLTISVAQAAAFPETCGLSAEHNAAALLAAICEPGLDRHARQVLNTARAALHYAGIPVLKMLTTASLTEPGQWVDPDTGEHGPTIPYTDSVLYGRAAVDRVVINASRRDIEAEFAPTEPAPLLTVESTDFA
ncbi:DUF4192 family protein, partial [uncultured Mycobacterium sp.]|uniref:DUF4192 family protein n=1 Tax=uncultured Mycobacterium sp. TaxID=171292 RepID=UPI0035CA1134